jgi:hypothetical protein
MCGDINATMEEAVFSSQCHHATIEELAFLCNGKVNTPL